MFFLTNIFRTILPLPVPIAVIRNLCISICMHHYVLISAVQTRVVTHCVAMWNNLLSRTHFVYAPCHMSATMSKLTSVLLLFFIVSYCTSISSCHCP